MAQSRDYGDEEGLALDYRGSLLCLAGRDRALDRVPFDSRSLLTSYALYSHGQKALKPRLHRPYCNMSGHLHEMVRNSQMHVRPLYCTLRVISTSTSAK